MDVGLKVKINEPQHEISNNMVCVISKDSDQPARIGSNQPARIGSDQPAHTRSLIRAFASHLSTLWLLGY